MTIQTNITQSQAILRRYREIREQSLSLCAPLEVEDFVAQPAAFVSPPKWHLGHVTWFFENFILARYLDGYELFNERLNYCFNSYYQSQGPRILRNKRGNLTRPPLREVLAYRSYVDERMARLLGQYHDSEVPQQLAALIEVGLQHEQQHQELLVTDIKYILGHNPLHPAYREAGGPESRRPKEKEPAEPEFTGIPEGIYEIGYQGDGFCWDNEKSAHKAYLHEYAIANRLVTNGEYVKFIEAGGYENFEPWLDEGWAWAQQLEVKAPLYWYEQDGQWWHYTMSGLQPVDPLEPVTHISYYEADAYARWRGLRLPTEQEWEAACRLRYEDIPEDANFAGSGRYHPRPQQGSRDFQMLGDTWEWTGSAYLPYPNYPRFEGDLGEYNGKFMVNQMVLRGGSCATPASHLRFTYRNFFHADERWQFTGIRLAK
ncbi:MAG: ergothioneine biosynthesis protein EgtB [Phaeodactylibacter sp.]|nr:ergothioneine biosynthesis protein EgtB [Phaeodactylibacter sp.]